MNNENCAQSRSGPAREVLKTCLAVLCAARPYVSHLHNMQKDFDIAADGCRAVLATDSDSGQTAIEGPLIRDITDPARILDFKWLDNECIARGCQSFILKQRAEQAVLAERERCARLIEDHDVTYAGSNVTLTPRGEGNRTGLAYAAAIRAHTDPSK